MSSQASWEILLPMHPFIHYFIQYLLNADYSDQHWESPKDLAANKTDKLSP